MFPGSAAVRQRFDLPASELEPGQAWRRYVPFHLRAGCAIHPPGDVRLAYRLECAGQVIA